MKTSVIDVPRKHTQDDLFGIQVYQNALIKYIKLTDTPITIALQGEWGSGKTSLMNLLRYNLCDMDGAPYYPIWINTWQYSLMKTPSQAIMSILEGIISQIGALTTNNQKWTESKKKIGSLFKKMAVVGTKAAVGIAGHPLWSAVLRLWSADHYSSVYSCSSCLVLVEAARSAVCRTWSARTCPRAQWAVRLPR